MPLLVIGQGARSRAYKLINVGAVTEEAGRDISDEPWKKAADLQTQSVGGLKLEEKEDDKHEKHGWMFWRLGGFGGWSSSRRLLRRECGWRGVCDESQTAYLL